MVKNNLKMEFEFPKYPFIWNYSDMYNLINYTILNSEEIDENINFLLEKFPNSQIINIKQIIETHEFAQNLNLHTWYLNSLKFFETTELNIKIITNSKIKFKSNVKCFIFDPNDIFIKSEYNSNKKGAVMAIIKNKNSIIPELIPNLYIHVHNLKGILRFSPNDNNKINIKKDIYDGIFYVIMEKLIVKFNIQIKNENSP